MRVQRDRLGAAGADWLHRGLAAGAGGGARRRRRVAEAEAARGAKMAYQTFRQEYLQVPPVTRAYTTACVLTTAAVVSGAALHPAAALPPARASAAPPESPARGWGGSAGSWAAARSLAEPAERGGGEGYAEGAWGKGGRPRSELGRRGRGYPRHLPRPRAGSLPLRAD